MRRHASSVSMPTRRAGGLAWRKQRYAGVGGRASSSGPPFAAARPGFAGAARLVQRRALLGLRARRSAARLRMLAADREAELGDLAGRLRGGGGELGAARPRRPGLGSTRSPAPADPGRGVAHGTGAGTLARGRLGRGGGLERARRGGLRSRRAGCGGLARGGLRLRLGGGLRLRGRFAAVVPAAAVAADSCAAASAAGVASNVRGAAAFARFGFGFAAPGVPSRRSARPRSSPSSSASPRASRPASTPSASRASARSASPGGGRGGGARRAGAAAAAADPLRPRGRQRAQHARLVLLLLLLGLVSHEFPSVGSPSGRGERPPSTSGTQMIPPRRPAQHVGRFCAPARLTTNLKLLDWHQSRRCLSRPTR